MSEGTTRPRAVVCVDCGSADIGWSLETYRSSGPHRCRCHPCYLAYTRRRQNERTAQAGRMRKHGPPKPPNWARSARRICCESCGSKFKARNEHSTCEECSLSNQRAAEAHRRTVMRAGDRSITWRTVGEHDHWWCGLCGFHVLPVPGVDDEPWGATVDHIVPISRNGLHQWQNVQLAHRFCNVKRQARDVLTVDPSGIEVWDSLGLDWLVWTTAPAEVTRTEGEWWTGSSSSDSASRPTSKRSTWSLPSPV